MKVNVEIDCTPLEARQFFGLPDVQPMQTAVMDKLQKQMMSNIEKVSPESLMQSWFTFDPKIAERFQDMFVTMAGPRRSRTGQEVAWRSTAARRPRRAGFARRYRPDAGRGEGAIRTQREPAAVAAADARAAGRRPSRAGAAGIPRQRPVDGADAPLSAGNSATTPTPGEWAATSAACRGCAPRCATGCAGIHDAAGRKVSIVGWSLGGVYARDLALQAPDMVRSVVTLGSPFANDVRATNATRLYESLSGEGADDNPELRAGDCRRSAGSGHVDLFAHRRHRELANLPAAPLAIPPKISRSTSPAISGSASTRPPCGRSPIAWPRPRANSGNLTDRGRLPLHMRLRKMHNPDQCPRQQGAV